jgi:hypothetical protein
MAAMAGHREYSLPDFPQYPPALTLFNPAASGL